MIKPSTFSIVFSVFNEEESLPELMIRIASVIQKSSHNYELIFVDDGSTDGSAKVITDFREREVPAIKVKLIRFSRNFGHEAAMIAGIDHASGDAIICMDTDLQHPAELIPEMIARFEEGFEIVTMARQTNRGNSVTGNILSSFFYFIINKLSTHKLQENCSDFFLISRRVASVLRRDFRERNRFLRGIIQIIGFPTATIQYTAPERISGKTKYSFGKLSRLTTQAITSFSNAPLYFGIWFGFIFSILSVIVGIYSLWVYFFGKTPPSGYTTLILFLSICFSILFFLVGIIGIYTGYLFDEQKKRPIYIIEEIIPGDSFENT